MAMQNDDYMEGFDTYTDLQESITRMEDNSIWDMDIRTSDLAITGLNDTPLFADDDADSYHVNRDAMYETLDNGGSKTLLTYNGQIFCVRTCAMSGLSERAKIFGSALWQQKPDVVAEILNYGLAVQKGKSIVLRTFDRVTALHSAEKYEIMSISRLLENTAAALKDQFAAESFMAGSTSHILTMANWIVEDKNLIRTYSQNMVRAGLIDPQDMTPAVKFMTSNTSNSAVRLIPAFMLPGGGFITFGEEIAVPHRKENGGIDAYKEALGSRIYPAFKVTMEKISTLAKTVINNGPNAVVSVCKAYNIPKKYGDTARETIADFTGNGQDPTTAHDIYYSIFMAIDDSDADPGLKMKLQDSLARAVNADWSEHDVKGTVAW